MRIRTIPLGPLRTNGYLLSDQGRAVFFDPGDTPIGVLALLAAEHLRLTHVLLTHLHLDHFYGAARLAAETGAAVLASADDAFLVEEEIRDGGQMGYPQLTDDFAFRPVESGECEFLGRRCVVFPTPGHTPGGLTFHFPDEGAAFVGDLVFARAVGRTDFHGGDAAALRRSIESVILPLPDETVLYPGHGPATTVGAERAHNPFFRE